MKREREESRVKQVIVAAGILVALTVLVCGVLVGWRYLPGLLGEWIGMMVGVMTTPFFMEASFILVGLTLVMMVNHWRQKRDGDELVYLEQLDGSDVEGRLPEQASWAVFREKPLPGETPPLLARAEGALAIGDFEAAAEFFGAMSEDELKQPETLALRMELARATGRAELAAQLESELNATRIGAR